VRRRARSLTVRPGGREAGYTFPELIVAMMIGLLVAFGATSVVMMAVKAEPRTSARAGQLQQGRTMAERLVRELRQGGEVYTATASELSFLTRVHGSSCDGSPGATSILCRVTYSCDANGCNRMVQDPEGGDAAPGRRLVSDIDGPAVFTYLSPEPGQPPNYVGVELVFPSESGGESVTIADGAALRNWAPEAEPG